MASGRQPGASLLEMRHKLFLEYLTQPLHVTVLAGLVYLFGGFRAKVAFDLVRRREHAFAILAAADAAAEQGIRRVTVIECGVASGAGLWNMIEIGRKVTALTGVELELVGFDTGGGLPPPRDHRDHPELFQAGDFKMGDIEALRRSLPGNARLVLGDIAETAPSFLGELSKDAPVGYVAVDVDYYWSAVEALTLLTGDPELYLPVTFVYFDDVGFPSANDWCGERLAIREFNETHAMRKIQLDRFLKYRRVYKDSDWLDRLYKLHVLDHPLRQPARAARRAEHVL